MLNNYFVTGDYAAAGVTLRGAPVVNNTVTGTISIPGSSGPGSPGVPTGADLIDGFLYWTTIENSPSPSGSNATFLGYPISGQQIGSDLPYTDSVASVTGTLRVYRADINAYFQNGANGVRTGSGNFAVSLPAAGTNGVMLTEGAGLVVIYRVLSPNVPLKAVVIYDGSAIPTSSTTQNVQGFYDAAGGGNANGEVTTLFVELLRLEQHLQSDCARPTRPVQCFTQPRRCLRRIILSTQSIIPTMTESSVPGKAGPASTDFHGGEPGYYDVKTGKLGRFARCKSRPEGPLRSARLHVWRILSDGSCDPNQENLFPSPDSQGQRSARHGAEGIRECRSRTPSPGRQRSARKTPAPTARASPASSPVSGSDRLEEQPRVLQGLAAQLLLPAPPAAIALRASLTDRRIAIITFSLGTPSPFPRGTAATRH